MAGGFTTSLQIYGAGAAACAAVSAGLWFALIAPGLQQRSHRLELTTELSERRAEADGLQSALSADRSQLKAIHQDLAASGLMLEPASRINQRVAAIYDLADKNGLKLEEVHPGTPAVAPHFQKVPVQVTGSGSYPACVAFLHQLRTRFPDTGVESFDTTNANLGANSSNVAFKFELVWYAAK